MPHHQQGHDRHSGHSVAMFRDKFWWSLPSHPRGIRSPELQHWLGFTAPSFPGSRFIPAILGTIVFVYGGVVFVRGDVSRAAGRKAGMMTLISLAIVVAFAASLAATFGLFEIDVWWELASLITIMVLGHWLEMRAISQARGAIDALAALLPDTADATRRGSSIRSTSGIKCGRHCPCPARNSHPADGAVVEGTAEVDESMMTGESKAVFKLPGSNCNRGNRRRGGSLRVRITATGEQTALSGIMRLVATAQASSSRTQVLADRAAAILFYVAVASGGITFTYWWFSGGKEQALVRTEPSSSLRALTRWGSRFLW